MAHDRESTWTLLTLVIAIGVFFMIVSNIRFGLDADHDGAKYLLSSISQGLAATFALAFTITLVAIQLASEYTPILTDNFFNMKIKIYMGFFIISIIIPLILLGFDIYDKIWTIISLTFAVICLLLLIPFFTYTKNILKPSNLIQIVKENALNDQNNKKVSNSLLALYRIAIIAYSERDKKTIEEAIQAFHDIIIKSNDSSYRKEAVEYLEKLAEDCLDDRNIVDKILKMFQKISNTFIEKDTDFVLFVSQYIAHLGWRASDYQRIEIVEGSLVSLEKILNITIGKKDDLSAKILSWIIILGAYGNLRNYEYLEKRAKKVILKCLKEHPNLKDTSFKFSKSILRDHEGWVLKVEHLERFLTEIEDQRG